MTHGMYAGVMGTIFMVLVTPIFAQYGMGVSLFEYPEPLVFSRQRHFERGVSSTFTLLVSNGGGSSSGDLFEQWDLQINAEGNLSNGSRSIPVSSVWVKAKGNPQFRSMGRIFLSTNYQTIARSKRGFHNANHSLIEIKLKARKGDYFLKPAGEYSTYIYFTLMMD